MALLKPEFQWYLARSCNKRGEVLDLPSSTANIRNTKDLLENDWFDTAPGNKGWNICLILKKILLNERLYESSQSETPIKKEPRIKKEPQIKKEPRIKREPTDNSSYSDVQSLFVRPRIGGSQAPYKASLSSAPQLSSRKRSRTDLSFNSDNLPANPFQTCTEEELSSFQTLEDYFQTHMEERLSSFPALSNRTCTISPSGNLPFLMNICILANLANS